MADARIIRIMLVDDHFVVRMGILSTLEDEADLKVVAEAHTGESAVELFREHRPAVVLLDVTLPGMDGIETVAAIRQEFPEARVLMLSVNAEEEVVHRAVQAGAVGFLTKSVTPDELIEAIREADAGRKYFPSFIAERLATRSQRPELTEREMNVLRLLVAGRSNKEIGDDLKIAEPTVKQYVGGILRKLSVMDRTQAVTAAISRGLVKLP